MKHTEPNLEPVRLDLWLWAARFYKTRSLAKQAIEASRVEIDGQAVKASRGVRIGERLHVRRGDELFEIDILALSSKRGSAKVAQTLYSESEESIARRNAEREKRRLETAGYRAPASKPDKRARRLIQALGDLDAL
ncbi:MAG TPA: RNA-binding S4 domain-containing protein [Arenimonas sp.]|uniref:RNA-binding S4 domain-containing protein n=1 Tax=Arenimonas sp. TaxID=1872635 RepID=UPI002CFDAA25|nr:RNA-binding S4 domain-containing protein [Arenimonas sp.]HMB57508.1 RNA-binding S4 domain-containing protein [Arenimonas sp.]